MNIITKTIGPVAVLGILGFGFLNCDAQAAKITGTIDLAGSAQLNVTNLATATSVTDWFNTSVQDATGDFALNGVVALDPVAFAKPWTFLPAPGAQLALWTVDGFVFDLYSSTVVTQNSTLLYIVGSGVVKHAGFEDTDGSWAFTINNTNGGPKARFAFSGSAASVPDGGATAALLGLALGGIPFLRRRLADGAVA
ncbi:MAG: hypothetical protein RL088_467 [Verrucomicrobiota bacterium]|jgi:hypothetical protein